MRQAVGSSQCPSGCPISALPLVVLESADDPAFAKTADLIVQQLQNTNGMLDPIGVRIRVVRCCTSSVRNQNRLEFLLTRNIGNQQKWQSRFALFGDAFNDTRRGSGKGPYFLLGP